MHAKGGQASPLGELSAGRISGQLSRQARSGRCRSSAARARALILNGFFPHIMDAEAVGFLTARAALFSHLTHRWWLRRMRGLGGSLR